MDVLLVAWWLVAGWCGTPPWRQQAKHGRLPVSLAGLVGALIGGSLFMYLAPAVDPSDELLYATVSGLPALVLARVVCDTLGLVMLGPQPEPPD